jgi:multidrug resistance efflux pump
MLVAGMKMGQAQAQAQAQQQQQHAAEVEAARQEGAAQSKGPAPGAAGPSANVTAELQKLAELHKSGVLSDAEFAAAKAKLLG